MILFSAVSSFDSQALLSKYALVICVGGSQHAIVGVVISTVSFSKVKSFAVTFFMIMKFLMVNKNCVFRGGSIKEPP